ncbi:hypothetical protein F4680DRAFT_441909 [Xylaria scruposa]|nr:hypothetical protein F4680DRAFT_441909 [Xylaria scruposa]
MSSPTPQELASLSPEYLAEDNNSRALLATSIAFIVVSTVIYTLFVISRVFYANRNGWETWTLYPLSYICNMGLCTIGILLNKIGGSGRHTEYFLIHNPTTVTTYLQLQTATEFVYMAAVTVPKVALLLLYIRIFAERKYQIMAWIVIAVAVTHFWTSGVIVGFTICQPFSFKWDKSITYGKCADLMAAYRFVSVPNLLTDVAILLLPFPTLYRLQMSKTRKVGLFITFLTGGLGIIAAIIRLIGFYTVDLASDPTYYSVNTMTYTIIEPGAYFICSCLPGMRPFLRGIYHKSGMASLLSIYSKSAVSRGSHAKSGLEIALGNPKGSHKSSITAFKKTNNSEYGDTAGFIRLEKTVDVDNTDA